VAGIVFDARHRGAPFSAAAEAVGLAGKYLSPPLRQLEACELPSTTAQAVVKKEAFKRHPSLSDPVWHDKIRDRLAESARRGIAAALERRPPGDLTG